jgi:choline dehydrogenase-like flavoprotein
VLADARRLDATGPLECDVCVVGGGPAGITLALELGKNGRSVCLLESGGLEHEPESQSLLAGEVAGGAYPPLIETRCAMLGGATGVWAGWCRPLDAIDFSSWPFDRAALEPHYARAHDLLGLGEYDYSHDGIAPAGFTSVLFRQSRGSFIARHGQRLQSSRHVRVLLHATALRIGYSADGHHVQQLVVGTGPGLSFEIRPRSLVVAAGGIETARLLLSSAHPHPLVGRHFTEHVFVEAGHFVPARAGLADGLLPNAGTRGGWAMSEDRLRETRLLNGAMYLNPAHVADDAFANPDVRALLEAWDMLRGRAVPHDVARRLWRGMHAPRSAIRALSARLRGRRGDDRRWPLRALFECASAPDNRVELGDARDALGRRRALVRWEPQPADLQTVMRTHALLDEALRREGFGHLEVPPADAGAWREHLQPALHHLGTARMHQDPAQGVVDAEGRAHGVDNLYVTGGAVFPTGGYANPTLTLVALALRLAAHLRDAGGPRLF